MKEYTLGPQHEDAGSRKDQLFSEGPCLDVYASGMSRTSGPSELQAGGFTSRAPARALIDTGADLNAIDNKLALRVGMPKIAETQVRGMTGPAIAPVYLGRVFISALDRYESGEFFGAVLSERPYRVILGRSFLERYAFRYDGFDGRFYLRPIDYRSPSDI